MMIQGSVNLIKMHKVNFSPLFDHKIVSIMPFSSCQSTYSMKEKVWGNIEMSPELEKHSFCQV